MSNTIYLTKPNTSTWRWHFSGGLLNNGTRMWWCINYMTTGDFPAGLHFTTFFTAWSTKMASLAFLFMPQPQWSEGVEMNWTLPSGYWQCSMPLQVGNPLIAAPATQQVGAWITLKTDAHDRSSTGRIHYPALSAASVDGDRISSLDLAAIRAVMDDMIGPFNLLGVTHQMCVWSRKLDRIMPVTGYRIDPIPAYLRKRRPRFSPHQKKFIPINWPIIKFVT